MSIIKFSSITVPNSRFGSKKERGKGTGKRQVARQAQQDLCELHFSIGFPEEQLKFPILTTKHLLILDNSSLQLQRWNTSSNTGLDLALFLRRTNPCGGISCRDYTDSLPCAQDHLPLPSPQVTTTTDVHHPPQQQFKPTSQTHLQWIFPSTDNDPAQLQEDRDHLYHNHTLICPCCLASPRSSLLLPSQMNRPSPPGFPRCRWS